MSRPTLGYRVLVGLILLFLAGLLAGCGDTVAPSPTPAPPPPTNTAVAGGGRATGTVTPVAGYSLPIVRDGQVLKAVTAQEISGLPQQAPEIGGRPMSGASFRVVLALAGVTAAQAVTVRGTDNTRSGPATVTLPWSALTDDVLLGINQRGQAKFFGATLPGEQWVVDVTEIEVK